MQSLGDIPSQGNNESPESQSAISRLVESENCVILAVFARRHNSVFAEFRDMVLQNGHSEGICVVRGVSVGHPSPTPVSPTNTPASETRTGGA